MKAKASENLSEAGKKDLTDKEVLEEKLVNFREKRQIFTTKFNQTVRRLSKKLSQENKLKRRRLGAGAKPLLDSDDDNFIAAAIENKSTAHGRRHDQHLLSLADYSLHKKGKRLIKSASTVYLRGRPKRVNTIEGKRHSGKTCGSQILGYIKGFPSIKLYFIFWSHQIF